MKIRKSLAVLGASAALAFGLGGAMAPAAHSVPSSWGDDATYTQTDLRSGISRAGMASEALGGQAVDPPRKSAALRCWNPYLSGRTFAVSCSGSRWYVYTDCSNDRRYTVGPLAGAKRVAITCPAGTRAERGGAYGY